MIYKLIINGFYNDIILLFYNFKDLN